MTDETIALLESLLQVYIARVSLLQSRLLSTLDALDEQNRTHEEDMISIRTERDQIKRKLQRYVAVVNQAEMEKDDMRDAVMKLIEKVEISNDYSKWPHSQIYLSSLADASIPNQNSIKPPNDSLVQYAASLIETLRKQRDAETLARMRSCRFADKQIAMLNAKLSRRDAELESGIADVKVQARRGDRRRTDDDSDDAFRREIRAIEEASRDESVALLDVIAARNRTLETEVKILSQRLKARSSQGHAYPSRRQTSPTSVTHALNNPDDSHQPGDSKHDFRNEQHDQTPRFRGSGEDTTLVHKLVEPDQLRMSFQDQVNELGLQIDNFAAERRAIVESIGLAGLPNLQTEHEKSTESLHPSDDLHLRLRHANLECDRMKQTETELREQLRNTRTVAQEREAELWAKVHSLTEQLRTPRLESSLTKNYVDVAVETETQYLASALYPCNTENLLEPNDGEISMELATPLMPTNILVDSHPAAAEDINVLQSCFNTLLSPLPRPEISSGVIITQAQENGDLAPETEELENQQYVDPPSIPLPHSPESEPEGLSAWEENSLSGFTISASDFPIPPQFSST